MLLHLQNSIIYGPVNSRRLGCSLGINLLPFKQKTCTLDCLYCQYGWTEYSKLGSAIYPPIPIVISELKTVLRDLNETPDYITFSGNGEPTLHPDIEDIVEAVKSVRDQFAPKAQVAILSNSTTVDFEHVKRALNELDVCIMKLDAGDLPTFNRFNRPHPKVRFEDIIKGLKSLADVTIQTLFTAGKEGNFNPDSINQWIERIVEIQPIHVQIYTLDRGYPTPTIEAVSKDKLLQLGQRLKNLNVPATVY